MYISKAYLTSQERQSVNQIWLESACLSFMNIMLKDENSLKLAHICIIIRSSAHQKEPDIAECNFPPLLKTLSLFFCATI